ncbi:MAG: HIT domain-containing protein [Rickettsiales bacterium]|jgi:diadenosine tetraphosphate (Ap4A) HIT family hydrolase|nr:HIT domain-containing protein [Rickettsiales bacterium]
MYDKNNIFAKMLRGEVPFHSPVYENEYAVSFLDLYPATEKHALVIPRGEYENILDFTKNASPAEQAGFWECFNKTAEILGVRENFNVSANAGADAPVLRQSVFHFHLHIMAGARLPYFEEVLKELNK